MTNEAPQKPDTKATRPKATSPSRIVYESIKKKIRMNLSAIAPKCTRRRGRKGMASLPTNRRDRPRPGPSKYECGTVALSSQGQNRFLFAVINCIMWRRESRLCSAVGRARLSHNIILTNEAMFLALAHSLAVAEPHAAIPSLLPTRLVACRLVGNKYVP